MRDYSWKEKRNKLGRLIKQVSDKFGGDDVEWLRMYFKEVAENYREDLDKAIICFQSMT